MTEIIFEKEGHTHKLSEYQCDCNNEECPCNHEGMCFSGNIPELCDRLGNGGG